MQTCLCARCCGRVLRRVCRGYRWPTGNLCAFPLGSNLFLWDAVGINSPGRAAPASNELTLPSSTCGFRPRRIAPIEELRLLSGASRLLAHFTATCR